MGLMQKILGRDKPKDSGSHFQESRSTSAVDSAKSRSGPHRELVQMTLRETMRSHGIPTDWIDCRTLSVLTRQHKPGMHVQFLVRKADQQILPWVHEFQESFWEQILRTDPQAHDWLFSVGWEFYGKAQQGIDRMPGAGSWSQEPDTQALDESTGGDTMPTRDEDDVAADLQRLQAVMTQPGELTAQSDPPATGGPRS